MARGIVYILTNTQLMKKGLIKIGRTGIGSLRKRLGSLSSQTGTEEVYDVYYAAEVSNAEKVELHCHQAFKDQRRRKEFFEINPERVRWVLKLVEERNVTHEDDFESDPVESKKKASPFRFTNVGIPKGAILGLIYEGKKLEDISTKVANHKEADIDGTILPLTKAVEKILETHFKINRKNLRASRYLTYKGELLIDRQKRGQEGDRTDP